jgi:hypothetical protein
MYEHSLPGISSCTSRLNVKKLDLLRVKMTHVCLSQTRLYAFSIFMIHFSILPSKAKF